MPGYWHTIARGINEAGDIVGYYVNNSGLRSGFLRKTDGSYVGLTYQDESTWAFGNNDVGQIVGQWQEQSGGGKYHSWLRNANGQFTSFDAPLAQNTYAYDLNDDGWIVGLMQDLSGGLHGFVRDATGSFTIFDVPDASTTGATSINDAGQITGFYLGNDGREHGFVATAVPEPATMLLLGAGIAGLAGAKLRRKKKLQ